MTRPGQQRKIGGEGFHVEVDESVFGGRSAINKHPPQTNIGIIDPLGSIIKAGWLVTETSGSLVVCVGIFLIKSCNIQHFYLILLNQFP